jgi:hypothetical protein
MTVTSQISTLPDVSQTSKCNKKVIYLQRIRLSLLSLEWLRSLGPKSLCDGDTGLARMELEA